jgi:hypothetical protein
MAIETHCPHCLQTYTLADSQQGKRVRCRNCSEGFVVGAPAPAAPRDRVARRPPRRDAAPDDYDDRDYEDDRPRGRRDEDDYDDREYEHDRPAAPRKGGIPLWVWLAGGGGLALLVLVVGVVVILLASGAVGNKVTAENYQKLKMGMSEAEVRAILGNPSESADAGAFLGRAPRGLGSMRVLVWKSGRSAISVGFMNDKVTSLQGVNLQ